MKDSVLNEFLDAGTGDWVSDQDAHFIASQSNCSHYSGKYLTLVTLKELFDRDIMVPGDTGPTFQVWDTPRKTWINSIIDLYQLYEWRPYGGAFWLCLTEKGKRLASERLNAKDQGAME